MFCVRGPAWLVLLGTLLLGGGFLVWVIGALSESNLFEAVGQILYGLGCATWGVRLYRSPATEIDGISRPGPVWLILAGIGFAAMTIIELILSGV